MLYCFTAKNGFFCWLFVIWILSLKEVQRVLGRLDNFTNFTLLTTDKYSYDGYEYSYDGDDEFDNDIKPPDSDTI